MLGKAWISIMVVAVVSIAACSPHSDPKSSVAKPAAVDNRPRGQTGIPIDPTKKTVVIEDDRDLKSSASQARIEALETKQAHTQQRLARFMSSYANNVNDHRGTRKLTAAADQDLEAYKRQTLDLYNARRQQSSLRTASDGQ